ncbi:HpcH/HpaI aldolase family protein [Agrobacterium rubi]|uniref:4-hydroxy-2-oxovalerate aldolase n=1 Tax=Agrobacterium rubi TaxID=28099 RepID=A0AAE7R789_9HYPH|nr:aldolase/citrate lyase family protein [Agrobacterium rubi]MCL6652754.1 4-hydroxy-2-oxovalerate aldolase [Agrobacterium rubi]NTE88491.1 4-hydroxy-2-oxovalerate aldolase [Agrobacterium rubi]NTF04319.1 4-hydroxy-2-oxovalerate aldolase [Agrobacterium rubi]NTF09852.1 4-hydroxy-2-oxovalerate aldolase [Agrobacterium rubi]NTF21971.1 4-hydroxy-2-oxovalerate aldolase [Agrobacterium rubi]
MSDFRKACLGQKRLIGTFAAIPHPVAIEVVAAAGPDFICIDAEHSQIGRELIENLIRAADVHRVPAMVRVPGHAPEAIAGVLDAGAAGVLVPRVSTAAHAKAAVAATRYPPVGERGVGPGRAAGYGYRIPDYLKSANESLVLAIQIETAEGLANVEEIVAVEGIDVIFIGPGDLSVSINALGPEGAAKLEAAILTITQAAIKAGKTVGIFRPSPDDVAKWSQAGISFYLLASDTMFLGASVAAGVTAARDA